MKIHSNLRVIFWSLITLIIFSTVNCGKKDSGKDSKSKLQSEAGVRPTGMQKVTLQSIPYYSFSTLIDGNSGTNSNAWELVRDVAYDSTGNMYVTGGMPSPDFPTVNAYDSTFHTGPKYHPGTLNMDVFVMKISPQGKILWSTYLGSGDYDRAYALELGPQGDVYVAGRAGQGFPVTPGVAQPNFAGDNSAYNRLYGYQDGFVAKFTNNGQLIWSTYIGDAGPGIIRDIAVDSQDRIHIAFTNLNRPLPYISSNATQKIIRGSKDAAYIVLSGDGTTIIHATYFGGSDGGLSDGLVPSIRVNSKDEAIFYTSSNADDLPITANAMQKQRGGDYDNVIVKFNSSFQIDFCTYIGGIDTEFLETHQLALDAADNIYVTGGTKSPDFPIKGSAYQSQFKGVSDVFVAKVSADGSTLLASTYVGGANSEYGEGMTFDIASDQLVITGNTISTDFPVTSNALVKTNSGLQDAFLAVFDSNLQPSYISYFGGTKNDQGRAVAVSPQGKILFGGMMSSPKIPLKNAFDTTHAGLWGAFVTEIGFQ